MDRSEINKNIPSTAVFKMVQFTPVGQLKRLSQEELGIIRSHLSKEVREVGRALRWIDEIIRIKNLDSNNTR